MATAILNVSLDEKVCPLVTAQRRYDIVRAALRLAFGQFGGVIGEIRHVEYTGPDGQVSEDCGVFQVEFDYGTVLFEHALYGVANALGQDCIAVLYWDGRGCCIGPRSDRWPFDAQAFNLPSTATMQPASSLQAAA
jgi:hypothetical protein